MALSPLPELAGRRQNHGFRGERKAMKRTSSLACILSIASLALAGIARGEEPKKPVKPVVNPQVAEPVAPGPPQPGPEHAQLRKAAGVWDATVEMSEAPGKQPTISKGTETSTLIANGLWLVTDFKADMG